MFDSDSLEIASVNCVRKGATVSLLILSVGQAPFRAHTPGRTGGEARSD
jgi:hypothetical protein